MSGSTRARAYRHTRWLAALLLTCPVPATGTEPDRDTVPIGIEEWSIWVSSPIIESLNPTRGTRNAMPRFVGTTRPRSEDADSSRLFPIAPLSVIQFTGEPAEDVDLEVRLLSGSILAHWPPARERVGSLRWFGANFSRTPPEDHPLPHLPEGHPVQPLRRIEDALYLHAGSRAERFLAYDAELPIPTPLSLEGGPDEYSLQNLSKYPLHDLAVIVPTEEGYRIGWLDELPSGVADAEDQAEDTPADPEQAPRSDHDPAEAVFEEIDDQEAAPEAPAEPLPPLPNEADAETRARVEPLLDRPVALNASGTPWTVLIDQIVGQVGLRSEIDAQGLAAAGIDPSARAADRDLSGVPARDALAQILGDLGLSYRITEAGSLFITSSERLEADAARDQAPPKGPVVRLSVSPPMPASDTSYVTDSREALARRLLDRGLREDRIRMTLDHLDEALFRPDDLIVVAHLSAEAIEEIIQLDVFPPAEQTVRVATVVIHGMDPRLADRAREFVGRLGDPAPEVRDAAEASLLELGPPAIPELQAALSSPDIEVVFRAERLLLRLNQPLP